MSEVQEHFDQLLTEQYMIVDKKSAEIKALVCVTHARDDADVVSDHVVAVFVYSKSNWFASEKKPNRSESP